MELPILEISNNDSPKYNLQLAHNEANKPKDPTLALSSLTEDEQSHVQEFMQKIDISNANIVMSYGAPAQNKIASFSDSVLQNVKSKDMGEVGIELTNLVVEIKSVSGNPSEKQGSIRSFFKNIKKGSDRMIANFNSVEANIDTIVRSLQSHSRTLEKDVAMLEEMYKNNMNYFKELTLYIIAGSEKLSEFRRKDIEQQKTTASQSQSEIDAQKLNDMVNLADRFEKKLHDLKLSRMISIQMAPQIRLVQNNDISLIEQIQSSIVNSIPLWKNQMVIALGMQNSKAAMAAQNKVTDMTNDLLIKNSEMLKQGSIDVAEASQRGIVEVDTIRKTSENLIDTINSVLDIQQKGQENRRAAEGELIKIEEDLKKALVEASTR